MALLNIYIILADAALVPDISYAAENAVWLFWAFMFFFVIAPGIAGLIVLFTVRANRKRRAEQNPNNASKL